MPSSDSTASAGRCAASSAVRNSCESLSPAFRNTSGSPPRARRSRSSSPARSARSRASAWSSAVVTPPMLPSARNVHVLAGFASCRPERTRGSTQPSPLYPCGVFGGQVFITRKVFVAIRRKSFVIKITFMIMSTIRARFMPLKHEIYGLHTLLLGLANGAHEPRPMIRGRTDWRPAGPGVSRVPGESQRYVWE